MPVLDSIDAISNAYFILIKSTSLGFLVDFISIPVVSGFTSAAAFMIASAQVKGLLGLHFDAESFSHIWTEVYNHIHETQLWDAVLGGSCCVFLLSLKVFEINKVIKFFKTLFHVSSSSKTFTPPERTICHVVKSSAANAFGFSARREMQ